MMVSIITVCYNAANHIEDAIKSVLAQSYKNIEYIIVDGKSTDGTLDLINKYRDKISMVVSEDDDGIYDAMNKGIRLAAGDIIYFLNSDDRLNDKDVISDVVNEFNNNHDVGLIYGKVHFINVPPEVMPYVKEYRIIKKKNDLLEQGLCHQSIFVKKWVFDKTGCFGKSVFYADFDWLLSVYASSVKMRFVDRYICFYNYVGFTYQDYSNKWIMARAYIIYKYFPFGVFLFYLFRYILLRRLNSKRKHIYMHIKSWAKNFIKNQRKEQERCF
ncbi:MAG: glycosyltransferase [Nitrospirae bacterium]|nr:glycosyltransferase [Nitrospirota bacterium]